MNICQLKDDVLKNMSVTVKTASKEEFQKCFKHGSIFGITIFQDDYFQGKVLSGIGFDIFTCKIGQITL